MAILKDIGLGCEGIAFYRSFLLGRKTRLEVLKAFAAWALKCVS